MSETPRPDPDPDATAEPEPVELDADATREWWQDRHFRGSTSRRAREIACFTWLGIAAAYALVISILRRVCSATAPKVLASLGLVERGRSDGAMAQGGDPWWPLVGWSPPWLPQVRLGLLVGWQAVGTQPDRDLVGQVRARPALERPGRALRAQVRDPGADRDFLPIPLPRAVILAVLGEREPA